jgi:broad-specificity NMP kinase
MRKIIAIGGVPGTGKTTLFRKFMEGKTWERRSPTKLVETHYCTELDLHILGKYEEGETYAGTDKLGMSCQPNMQKWIESINSNILFEGDRLTNSKFYNFLLELPDTEVKFVILKTSKDILQDRYITRGSNQSEVFLKGRDTKIDNILSNLEYMDTIIEFRNETMQDQAIILSYLEEHLFSV